MVVAVIAVGSWIGSRADADPDTGMVDASAVVVSSLACTAGSGKTLVDVMTPVDSATGSAPGRATLDACGYQEGQQLAVRYRSGELSTVALAETGGTTAPGSLLPLGLAVAGLLAIAAALAVYVDGRGRPARYRHAATDLRGHWMQDAEDGTPVDPAPEHAAAESGRSVDVPDNSARGRAAAPALAAVGDDNTHAAAESAEATPHGGSGLWTDPQSMQFPDHNGHGPFTAAQARATAATGDEGLPSRPHAVAVGPERQHSAFPWSPDDAARSREMSSVDLIFPYTSTLAASLQDELFTHRGVSH